MTLNFRAAESTGRQHERESNRGRLRSNFLVSPFVAQASELDCTNDTFQNNSRDAETV